LLAVLLIYFILPLLVINLPRGISEYRPILFAAVQLGTFVFLFLNLHEVSNSGPILLHYPWIPELGLSLDLKLDALSLSFGLLITGIGTLIFLFSFPYMKSYEGRGRFSIFLFLFSGAMLGLVFSENLILLFIFWELTTVLSFLLISFFHEKEEARKAAFQSLFLTGMGGLSLLAGIILLGSGVESYTISDWITNATLIRESPLYLPGLILVLLGALTKSAQFPFHFWLPGAMQAPGPVSAYLHSATMVKAGFYLLARLNPVLGGTTEWFYILSLAGVLTMLLGSYMAITKKDIKAILAFTTINALGVLVLLMGIDTSASIKAALLFFFVHAFYKAALFMVAGMLEKKTGTRDINLMGGLRSSLPLTFLITLLLALSMAGLPPMLGFLGKELIYEAKLQLPGVSGVVLVLGVLSNVFMVLVSLLFVKRIFLGSTGKLPRSPDEKGLLFLLGPAVLALLSLIFGIFPRILGNTLLESALYAVQTEPIEVKLKIWHGFNEVFFLSLFTVITGFGLTLLIIRKASILKSWERLNERVFFISPANTFQSLIEGFVKFSDRKSRLMQHGYHRYYIMTIFLFAAANIWFQVLYTWGWKPEATLSLRPFYISILVAVMITATVFITLSKSRIAAIVALGVIGYGISLIYLYYSAVDLAITQILVETLVVVMFVLVLQKLPRFAKLSSRRTKIRDLLIALSFGSVMTIIAIKAIHLDFSHPVSDYFIEKSYVEAFGKNVVNVILVDFRALDTMGEVIVLTIAAVGVALLFKRKKSRV
jgi:multicomponent Na+:H+ antiporter subunit A